MLMFVLHHSTCTHHVLYAASSRSMCSSCICSHFAMLWFACSILLLPHEPSSNTTAAVAANTAASAGMLQRASAAGKARSKGSGVAGANSGAAQAKQQGMPSQQQGSEEQPELNSKLQAFRAGKGMSSAACCNLMLKHQAGHTNVSVLTILIT